MVSFGSGVIVILFFVISILIEAFLSCNNVVKSPRHPLSLTLRRNVKAVTPDTNPTHKAKGSSIYSASTQKHRSPSNIEQMQKMQDEFYEPKKKEEELEDGELPSLSRMRVPIRNDPWRIGIRTSLRCFETSYYTYEVSHHH